MPLTYPIATSAKGALAAKKHARSKQVAMREAGAEVSLVSDWLRPDAKTFAGLAPKIEDGLRDGYVQLYETKGGRKVVAVTYWKRRRTKGAGKIAPNEPPRPTEDHTDDLYFSKSRKRRPAARRRRQPVDPRQMDLFVGPDRGGHESPDPQNPKVMLVEEEGVGNSIRTAKSTKRPRGKKDSTRPKK